MNLDEIAEFIKRNEGYRDEVYLDPLGIPTCGWGHALHVGSSVPFQVANYFFADDFRGVITDYDKLGLHLYGIRKAVVMDMLYQLGLKRFLGFKRFIAAVRDERWADAAAEILDSKMAKQTPNRANKNAEYMLKGDVQP